MKGIVPTHQHTAWLGNNFKYCHGFSNYASLLPAGAGGTDNQEGEEKETCCFLSTRPHLEFSHFLDTSTSSSIWDAPALPCTRGSVALWMQGTWARYWRPRSLLRTLSSSASKAMTVPSNVVAFPLLTRKRGTEFEN